MAKEVKFDANNIIHPGYLLGMEIKARGITQKNFASQIAIQQSHLSEIIKGKRNITDQLAQKLEQTLGIPAEHWIKLQAEYGFKKLLSEQKNVAEREAESTLTEYNLIYDMRTIFNYVGIIAKPASERLRFCTNNLKFTSPTAQRQQVRGCFHRSEKTGLDTRMIATWAVLAKYEASIQPKTVGNFDKDKMDDLSKELSIIFNDNNNTLNRTERKLSEYGIKFCIVPKVKHASIDGYSFFTDDGTPAIVITKRYNKIDNVAFAVLHEVGHLKLHSVKDNGGNINLVYGDEDLVTKEEREANEFAANALIPEFMWEEAPRVTMNPHQIQKEYSKWARKNGLNKWIVLGRVSHETGMYMFTSDKSRDIQ